MRTVLLKVTARRTKDGLKTVKREVVGCIPEDTEQRLDRLARILAEMIMKTVRKTEEEV